MIKYLWRIFTIHLQEGFAHVLIFHPRTKLVFFKNFDIELNTIYEEKRKGLEGNENELKKLDDSYKKAIEFENKTIASNTEVH